jgi:hypothetical protein
MQCQVLYHTDGSKSLQSKGFSNIEEANKWLNTEGGGKSNYTQNARIVVDYAAVEAFQEMYELMRNQVFGKGGSQIQKERKQI